MANKITPITTDDTRAARAQLNANLAKLDADTVTKAYKGPTGQDAVIEGQLPNSLGSGIVMNDLNGTPNIYMATTPAGQPVLKIAKTGKDATTGADQDLIFNSARNTFKIVGTGEGSVSYTVPATAQVFSTNVPHNLGYVPIVLAFWDNASGGRVMLPYDILGYDSATGILHPILSLRIVVDSVNLALTVVSSSKTPSPGTASFKYYILAESAN